MNPLMLRAIPYAVAFALGASIAGWGTWKLHGYLRDKAEIACVARVDEQKTASANACEAANKVSEGIANEHTAKITDLERRLAAARKLQPAPTVRIGDFPQGSPLINGTGNGGLCGGDVVRTDPFWNIADQASHSSIKASGLQDYVNKIQPFIAKCEGRAG